MGATRHELTQEIAEERAELVHDFEELSARASRVRHRATDAWHAIQVVALLAGSTLLTAYMIRAVLRMRKRPWFR